MTTAQPNILILMVDQLNGLFFPDGPAEFLHVPHLRQLARRSTRFSRCYTASPLCAPARAAFMSGQLPSRTGVYDNAAEFSSEIPTYAHYLRNLGYQTILSGKMHFVGPDQLHGFEQRLTTDIYPADFGWTPDYRKPDERVDWWYHNLDSVANAGTAEITNQMEYDDEVAFQAGAKLYDLARGQDSRPWAMTVSFTHPHDPYVARPRFLRFIMALTNSNRAIPRRRRAGKIRTPGGCLMPALPTITASRASRSAPRGRPISPISLISMRKLAGCWISSTAAAWRIIR